MPMNLLVTPVFIVLAILSGVVLYWAFATCDEDDEYNKWD